MDQLAPNSIPIQQNCIIHPQNKLAFIQVNEIPSLPNSNIFQCVDCFEQDLQFRGANYMLIQKIIENSDSDFHYKWPPLNDQQIVQNIHLKAKNLNSTQSVLNQINSYFTQLKDEIIKKIDVAQKKAINQALEMPFGKEQILKRYQEISQIQNLKSLLMQDQNKSFALYQKSCKDFIQQVQLNKAKNTQLLQELLNQCDKIQQLVDFDRLNKSKIFLLEFLDQLNFFEDQTQSQVKSDNNLNNNILPQQDNNKIDQLMKLISNKTNYCSEEFLNQIRQQMQKLSLFFEQISFDKMNQEGKKAIKFSELNDEKINSVNEYVEHLIKLQDDPQHLQSVKNSFQISNLLNVLDNKFNFISNNYRDNLMRYLIETYPFSKNINTDEMFSEEQSFNILRSLETNYIKEFVKIVKKKQNLNENQQNFDNSQTYRVQQTILESFSFEKPELENTLKQFPIFDLLLLKGKNILNQLQFQKSNFQDGNQRIEIVKNMNNQFEISLNQTNYQGSYKKFLDQLNFFEDQTQSQVKSDNNLNNNILPQQDNNKIDQLMKLISNKTNYCSEEFLNQIRQQMQKLSLFFEQISFDKMNQEGKKAIKFSELNDEKINSVNEYVEHLIKLQDDPQHLQSVKNSFQISNLLNVLDNKFNFISNNYRDNLMRYLIETYPFSKNINTDEMFSEEQSFNILRSLETNYIKEFVKIVKKKQNLNENQQNFDNSQTYRVQQTILESFSFEKPELENTLKQFPIFDLLLLKGKNILNQLQFQKSNFQDGNQRIEIVKNMNNQFEISLNQTNYQGSYKSNSTNCISQILERDKKYIFRIQFQKGNNGLLMIGLMKNENFNRRNGFNDKMSYYFKLENNKMKYNGQYGIDKFVKGDFTQLLDENSTLELRVWLEGQQLEVLNYPDYSYKVEIQDEFKQNLSQKDLCLYFYLIGHQDKYILKEALIVEQF
ncbi:hypothetical protein TTHERM_00830510 (macronuclear) [Tetrahymena thermophila SB210]|uniref:Zinc carboxypeptidase family protein n=1 Tax=Tetrahymena thermophila (strain SB210) TaxID=312017 RepID=Q23A70_TETTS|nr:hypothetical protein TTHERM_00830510 [Tetrahymena thermophila SB210]EAR93410.3 hypothetical protein TTHERM_00830510 [Tetrahymena thermophila SB210]|eukprot:XP_001013655.3 hypothetical protein TTHERM_00830510 [Tetrahymena thermophila SB210]